MLLQETVNTVIQLVVVLLLTLLFWVIVGRRKAGYFSWIGLIVPTTKSVQRALLVFLAWSLFSKTLYLFPEIRDGATADNTVAGQLSQQGFSLEIVMVILLVAGVKTALAEEILFRGLIGKRLINGLGFQIGNLLQALFFGSIHLLIFAIPGGPDFTLILSVAFFLVPATGGWLMGYVNHRDGNGSIMPGWIMHAFGNALGYPILAFLV